jgi:GMP synthase (glutamine-hydrolysing)
VRELNVYSEIIPWHAYKGLKDDIQGVILSGSPHSVRDQDAPRPDLSSVAGSMCLCSGSATGRNTWPRPTAVP